jgi:hypothetical protein
MVLSNLGENLALLNNGSNGDSVPATVPGSELVRLTRQRLNLGPHPYQSNDTGKQNSTPPRPSLSNRSQHGDPTLCRRGLLVSCRCSC